jgi:nucleotide-binding universal stress UspA family protein
MHAKILVALDGSDDARHAGATALQLAARTGAELLGIVITLLAITTWAIAGLFWLAMMSTRTVAG